MEIILRIVEIIALLVIAGSILWIASTFVKELRKFGRTAEDVSHFLQVAEEEISNTTREARIALADADKLISNVNIAVEKVDKAAEDIHRVLDITMIATTTARAVKTSTAGFTSVYEGIKQGIRALYGSHQTQKGGTEDEQR